MTFSSSFLGIPLFICAAVSGLITPRTSWAADSGRPIPVKPEHTRPPQVRLWSSSFSTSTRFSTFEAAATGGGFVASGDVNGDGRDEIVIGSGPGRDPEVRVFEANGKQIGAFSAYVKGFRGGVRIAVADVDGDGRDEIITAPGPGISSLIHVYSAEGKDKLPAGIFPAYASKFIGGVRVAAIDLNGDGKAEIITAPGPGGGPHIKIFDGSMKNLGYDFFPYDAAMTDGVTVAALHTPQGPSIVTGIESWSLPLIKRYVFQNGLNLASEFLAFASDDKSGVTVAAFDVDHDGYDEIAAAGNGGRSSELRIFDVYGTKMSAYLVQDPTYRGGVSLAQIDRDGDTKPEIAIMPVAPVVNGPTDIERKIDIDISEQRLYAYERGRIAKTFLVSTGVGRHATPIGKTSVTRKIPIMDYRWSYGANHPDNYNIKNVKYNLNIFPHIYIHSAYWHSNFGHRMSHGCINTSLKDAEWIYNWAATGTAVETKE